jgi:hypothetical protein
MWSPYGLGFRACKTPFALDTLGLHVPRKDLDRCDALNVCNRVTRATEEEVTAAWEFLSERNRCHLSWQMMVPCRVGCVDGDNDGSTHGSLEDCDPDFRMDAVVDLETEVLLQPGASAEVPVAWQARAGEPLRPEEFEVRPSPHAAVDAGRGLWGENQRGRVIVANCQIVASKRCGSLKANLLPGGLGGEEGWAALAGAGHMRVTAPLPRRGSFKAMRSAPWCRSVGRSPSLLRTRPRRGFQQT